MNDKEKTYFIPVLKILFIILNFLIPAILILWGSSEFGPFSGIPVVKGMVFFLLFFLVLPVSVTYLIVSLNRVFPDKTGPALALFLPYIVNIVIYWIQSGFSAEFLTVWMIQSLPLFLGYILALILGFILLLKNRSGIIFQGGFSENVPGFLFALFLITVFFLSWLAMFFNGIRLLVNGNAGMTVYSAVLMFTLSMLLVFLFHFRLLKLLYKEGKL